MSGQADSIERLRKLGDSRQGYLMAELARYRKAIHVLYVLNERPKLREELSDWKSEEELFPSVRSPEPDWFTYMARSQLLGEFKKQKIVEAKHQGRGRPILYRMKREEVRVT